MFDCGQPPLITVCVTYIRENATLEGRVSVRPSANTVTCKAPSSPAAQSKQQATMSKQRLTLSKQQSTLLPKMATMSNESIVKYHPFDKIKCCFDNAAVLGNNFAVLATMSNEILSFQQSQNKLNIFNLFRYWEKQQQVFTGRVDALISLMDGLIGSISKG